MAVEYGNSNDSTHKMEVWEMLLKAKESLLTLYSIGYF